MADNAQKTPLAVSLDRLGNVKAADAIGQLGKALPCSVVSVSGSIVTVKFEVQSGYTLPNITCPVFGPQYIRYPLQVGDKGVVFPADAYLGGVSGLGGGVASLTTPGNLSALVFFPIGNATWSAPDDPNAVVIYGPTGVIIRMADESVVLDLNPSKVDITGSVRISGNLSVGTGASGSFTTPAGQTVTVQDGIITNIY